MTLSRMDAVDLREVWPKEDRDFTPWLGEHITELGKALGIGLVKVETESSVGNRSLDILANDGNGRPVVIENQLEFTDGDHLSRLLIYAAGKDADIVVWVAKEFEDEHWQVLQWLNQRTDMQTKFFGVAVEVWKIEGSPPAPYFRVVSAPNDWRKSNVGGGGRAAGLGKRRKYRDFRQQLEDKISGEPDLPLDKGSDHSHPWLAIHIEDKFRYSVNYGSQIYVSFQIEAGSAQNLGWCYAAFERLERDKNVIESRLGKLEWTKTWQRTRGSQIACYHRERFPELPESRWPEIHQWILERYRAFREVFEPYRTELVTLHGQEGE